MTRAVAKQGFTMIPDAIAERTDIGLWAKCVYSYMARKCDRHGYWSGGVRLLAKQWGSATKTNIIRGIEQLKAAGLIRPGTYNSGQRAVYVLLHERYKAVHSGPVRETKSGPIETGAVHSGPEAVHSGPRKRVETSEKNTYMSPSSENGAEGKKKPLASELHESVVALFFPSSVPECRMSYVRRYVRELRRFSATPAEVRTRHKQWTELGYSFPCTLKTLVEHWDGLKPKPPNPYDPWDGKPPTIPPRDEDSDERI